MEQKLELLEDLTKSANWGVEYHKKKIANIKRHKNPEEITLNFHKKELQKEILRLEAFNDLIVKLS
jgi:hypothetical protein